MPTDPPPTPPAAVPEGWGWCEVDVRYHFFAVAGPSLCLAYYHVQGALDPQDMQEEEYCAVCRRKLAARPTQGA